MSAPAAAASSSYPAVGQPPEGFTWCSHTCGCTKYGCKGVQGRMAFRNLVNHLRGKNAHPECGITCPAFAREAFNMKCDEALSDSDDSEWGDGSGRLKKRKSDDVPPPLVPLSRAAGAVEEQPSPKKAHVDASPAYMPAGEFAAAAAAPMYLTSAEFQAAVLKETAKVNAEVQQLRVLFGKAQKDAIARREAGIRVSFGGEAEEAAWRTFVDELAQAGFTVKSHLEEDTWLFGPK